MQFQNVDSDVTVENLIMLYVCLAGCISYPILTKMRSSNDPKSFINRIRKILTIDIRLTAFDPSQPDLLIDYLDENIEIDSAE